MEFNNEWIETSAETQNLDFSVLSFNDIAKRFQIFHPGEAQIGIYENDAGILFPEKCFDANVSLQRKKVQNFILENRWGDSL